MKYIFYTLFAACLLVMSQSVEAAKRTYTDEHIASYVSNIDIRTDGKIEISEWIEYDFGTNARHGIFRTIPTDKVNEKGEPLRMNLENVEVVDEKDTKYKFSTSQEGENFVIKIGDADKTISGVHTYRIRYTVSGAMSYFSDVDELYWNSIGTKWEVPIENVLVKIKIPSEVNQSNLQYTCFFGAKGSMDNRICTIDVTSDQVAFAAQNLNPHEGLTTVVRFPMGVIKVLEPQPVVNFFDTFVGQITLAGILFLVVGWYIIYPLYLPLRWWLQGRDPKHQGTGVSTAWFEGPKLKSGRILTPVETGAVIDEKIQTREFVALIVQLAQKGYFKIVEKKKNDFELHKIKDLVEGHDLQKFEKTFLDTVFSKKRVVRIKDESTLFANLVPTLEFQIYTQLVEDGLFPKNPEKVRKIYLTITMIATATFNILLILSASIFGRIMPRKTLDGVHASNVAKSLKNFLSSQERQLEFQANKQMMFEKLLPYAAGFGVEKIWAKRFEDINITQPDWYEGQNINSFTAMNLSNSLRNSFSSTFRSATTTTSSSGFSSGFSGGSVGGGGGGGGGGSW